MAARIWTVPATMVAALVCAAWVVGAEAATNPLITPILSTTATGTGAAATRTTTTTRTVPSISRTAAAPRAQAGLVTQDQVALRAAPREAAPVQTLLWRGEVLEVRAERGDYLQVWDHQRERGGYVRKAQVHQVLAAGRESAAADELLAVLLFMRDQPGAEALGLALAAATIELIPAQRLAGAAGAEVLDAIAQQAERLAERASATAPRRAQEQAALSAHLDTAARHGVRLVSHQLEGRVLLCYDGDAWRRLLASQAARIEQRARATLALTRDDCGSGGAPTSAITRDQASHARLELLDRMQAELAGPPGADLPVHWRNRLAMRRASVYSSQAFGLARRGHNADAARAVGQAQTAMAQVVKTELADDDLLRFDEAALHLNAVRWAAVGPAVADARLAIATRTQDDGQTCLTLVDRRQPAAAAPLASRCTWGLVWAASVSVNREGNAVALAVQPADGWRELWVLRQQANGWTIDVLPPSPATPGLGYAEFAGWVPGGQQLLVAREAIAEGRSLRRFEVLRLDTLGVERQAGEPAVLGAFNRWPDPAWKRDSLALR